MRALVVLAVLAAAGMAASYAVRSGMLVIPDRWNPWAPLTIADAPSWLTRWKLGRLEGDPAQCRAVLSQAQMRYAPVPDRASEAGCDIRNAVLVARTSARVGEAFTLTCSSAVALALWEKHVLQPEALHHLGSRVAAIEHYGSYACRNVYGREGGRLSRHATANALDVAGFVLEDGRRVRVRNDWGGEGNAGRFLRAVRDGACRFYDGVLGPEYNAAHRDHLHLDRGPYRVCR